MGDAFCTFGTQLHLKTEMNEDNGSLSNMTLSEKIDRTGTISFGSEDIRYTMMRWMDWTGIKQQLCIEFVSKIRKFHELILGIQNKNKAG